jgi:hypothetical protein
MPPPAPPPPGDPPGADQPLDAVERELYALPPEQFTAARDERVAAARQAGDREAAKRIGALRRPTVAAWLVNLLALRRPELVDELLALGDQLRAAQHDLRGPQLRQLSSQRRTVVDRLSAQARELAVAAGRPARESLPLVEVAETLNAALSDTAIAARVRAGRLVRPESYAGFGEHAGFGERAGSGEPGRPALHLVEDPDAEVADPRWSASGPRVARRSTSGPAAPRRPGTAGSAADAGAGGDAGTAEPEVTGPESAGRGSTGRRGARRTGAAADEAPGTTGTGDGRGGPADLGERAAQSRRRVARERLAAAQEELAEAESAYQAASGVLAELERQLAQVRHEYAAAQVAVGRATLRRKSAQRAVTMAMRTVTDD